MKYRRLVGACFLMAWLAAFAAHAAAQKRDPLNDKEIDEMRESADYPDKRLENMVKFTRARIAAIEQLQANAQTAKDRPMQVHDLLEDFTALLDEIEDNLDMYGSHKADMRKGLTLLIEADSEWQLKLRRLKEQSPLGVGPVFVCAHQRYRRRQGHGRRGAHRAAGAEPIGEGQEADEGLFRAAGLT